MDKQKNGQSEFQHYGISILFIVLVVLLLTGVLGGLLKLIVGLIGGFIGLVVGLVAGIFGLIVGLIGGAIGIVFGVLGAAFGLVVGLAPIWIPALIIVALVRSSRRSKHVELPKRKNDYV